MQGGRRGSAGGTRLVAWACGQYRAGGVGVGGIGQVELVVRVVHG